MADLMYLPPGGKQRRSVLKRGLFGGALLMLGGAGFLATRGTQAVPLPKGGLKVLSEREFAVITAIAARMVRPRANFPTVEEVSLAEACDLVLARADSSVQKEIKELLMVFENALANALFGLRFKPFTAHSGEQQDEVLREWEQSSLTIRRTGFAALRTIALAAYYGNPKTWKAVGYEGPPSALHDPNAPVWKGGGEPRPQSLGQWTEEPPAEAPPKTEETPP